MISGGRWLDVEVVLAFINSGTDAFRLWSCGESFLDYWAGYAVLSCPSHPRGEAWVGELREKAHGLGLPLHGVLLRILKTNPGAMDAPLPVDGAVPSANIEVRENGVRYLCNLQEGYSQGLFCDQRANRVRLSRRELAGRSVLNCFAYTCAFSVVPALRGALTTSVDLSGRALAVGRENFQRNGLSLEGHRFVKEDVFAYLPRLKKRGVLFDVLVLDPPTFSRGTSARVFRAGTDFSRLLSLAIGCAKPRCEVLLSTNCRSLGTDALCDLAERVGAEEGWRVSVAAGEVPVDFAGNSFASTAWACFEKFRP